VAPNLNRRRALLVLDKIDEILAWERGKDVERDERFVELGHNHPVPYLADGTGNDPPTARPG